MVETVEDAVLDYAATRILVCCIDFYLVKRSQYLRLAESIIPRTSLSFRRNDLVAYSKTVVMPSRPSALVLIRLQLSWGTYHTSRRMIVCVELSFWIRSNGTSP